MKPEPYVDESGVPWCDRSRHCRKQNEISLHIDNTICLVTGRRVDDTLCLPKVQEMAAELHSNQSVINLLADRLAWFTGRPVPDEIEDAEAAKGGD